MNRQYLFLTLSVAIISGVLGGALSVWFLMPHSVLAQEGVPEVIEAREFRVVDDGGIVRAKLSVSGEEASLTFAHSSGNRPLLRLRARSDRGGNADLVMHDSEGQERASLGFDESLKLSYLSLYGPNPDSESPPKYLWIFRKILHKCLEVTLPLSPV